MFLALFVLPGMIIFSMSLGVDEKYTEKVDNGEQVSNVNPREARQIRRRLPR